MNIPSKRKLEIYAQSQYQLLTFPFILLACHNKSMNLYFFYLEFSNVFIPFIILIKRQFYIKQQAYLFARLLSAFSPIVIDPFAW